MFPKPEPVTPGATVTVSGGRLLFSALPGLFRWLLVAMLLLAAPFALAAPTTPTEDFTDNQDGTVTHRITGLTWMRCAMGMTWDGTTCTGAASTYTWDQATKLTANFAGKGDWRLPSIAELHTIVERETWNPAVNGTIFPGAAKSNFWSGSHISYWGVSGVWGVDFGYGYSSVIEVANIGQDNRPMVRLVRADTPFDPLAPYTKSSDFHDNGDGTVTHYTTGLMWKRCAEGQTWSGTACLGLTQKHDWGTAAALTSSSALHTDWRLPTENELLSIVEYLEFAPVTNASVFPNMEEDTHFWSSSLVGDSLSLAYSVDFGFGDADANFKTNGNAARLVRVGQFFSLRGFAAQEGVPPNSVRTSNTLKIAPREIGALAVSIVGGSYSINGGSYTAVPGSVLPNDSVKVQVNSAKSPATTRLAILTVGTTRGHFRVSTAGVADTEKPSNPQNLIASAGGDDKINLRWNAAVDDVGVTAYKVYRNGVWIATLDAVTQFTDAGLGSATAYTYAVVACDAATNCSDPSTTATASTLAAIPAVSVPTTPSFDFADQGDGTVMHKVTGLTWMRCALGTTWTGTTCAGTASTFRWKDAINLTLNFAGKTDWRLPSFAELNTIVARESHNPTINYSVFPNTPIDVFFWSASPYKPVVKLSPVEFYDLKWSILFFNDSEGGYDVQAGLAVRLVRGGGVFDPAAPYTPNADFHDNLDGTVTHRKTGLMWQRCAEGQAWDGSTCTGAATTLEWTTALALKSNLGGRTDWRLPTANELQTIVEFQAADPAINTLIFPRMAVLQFWSGSHYADNTNAAWLVDFGDGSANAAYKNFLATVRLVCAGQFFGRWGFISQSQVAPNNDLTSNSLKTDGISGPAAIAVTGGQYAINNAPYTSAPGTINPNDTVTVRVTSAPTPGTTTRATLTIGSISGDFVVSTAADAQAPATPTTLTATALSPSQVQLAWSASIDNTAVTSYRLYRNTALVATVNTPTTTYTDTQLSGTIPFTYTVEACDAAFNCSALSSPVSFTPSAALPITNPKLSAGASHAAGLKSDGNLLTWGFNEAGQLGLGTTTGTSSNNTRSAPQAVGSNTYTAIATGGSHSAAIQPNGNLFTWGGNASGQLGDGSTTSRTSPIQVGTGYMAVAAGNAHTLAIKTDGDLWAWGNNGTGQVGDGTSNPAPNPTRIGYGFYTAAAGTSHSAAIKFDGSLWAWGSNNFGQLGDGTGNDRYAPNLIGYGYTAVATGAFHTIALKTDGSLWAWGKNDVGQLGDATTQNRYAPVQIGVGFTAISVGAAHTLALKSDGTIWAWGANESGQLGNGTTTATTQPQQITSASDITAIAAGGNFSLALKSDGSVLSWGANSTGQLGDGTFGQRRLPVLVVNPAIDGFFNLITGSNTTVPTALKVPFFVSASGAITSKTATVNTTTKFAQADIGKSGAVFITARVPVGTFGAALGNSPNIARTPNATVSDGSTSVLVQLTSSGWKAVINGQLIPYVSGVLGEQTAAQSILDNTDTTTIVGAEFCVGYGSTADEMVGAGRMRVVATIPGLVASGVTTASCLITVTSGGTSPTLAADADVVFAWAERTYGQYFSPAGLGSQSVSAHRYRAYKDGHYLAVNENGEAHLYYLGPLSANVFLDLGLLAQWLAQAGL